MFYTLDLTHFLARVPTAIESSFIALGGAPAAAKTFGADVKREITQFEQLFPISSVPIPLIGGSIEFPLPLIIIDGLRLSGGFLNDTILRSVAGMLNFTEPQLDDISFEFEIGGEKGLIRIDPRFSTMMVTAEVVNRIDLLFAGIELGGGVSFIRGSIDPQVVITGFTMDRIDAALDALHLDEFVWSALVSHLSLGVEIGPPFLRLFARGRFLIPLHEASYWWKIGIGRFAGELGVVIRF